MNKWNYIYWPFGITFIHILGDSIRTRIHRISCGVFIIGWISWYFSTNAQRQPWLLSSIRWGFFLYDFSSWFHKFSDFTPPPRRTVSCRPAARSCPSFASCSSSTPCLTTCQLSTKLWALICVFLFFYFIDFLKVKKQITVLTKITTISLFLTYPERSNILGGCVCCNWAVPCWRYGGYIDPNRSDLREDRVQASSWNSTNFFQRSYCVQAYF